MFRIGLLIISKRKECLRNGYCNNDCTFDFTAKSHSIRPSGISQGQDGGDRWAYVQVDDRLLGPDFHNL
jgi:hypothetical protein